MLILAVMTRRALLLCHLLAFGDRVRKPFIGSPRATCYGDLKADASGSVASLGLFFQPEIHRLKTHYWVSGGILGRGHTHGRHECRR